MAAEKTLDDKNESIRIPSDGLLLDGSGRVFDIVGWDTTSESGHCSEITVRMRRRISAPSPPNSVTKVL